MRYQLCTTVPALSVAALKQTVPAAFNLFHSNFHPRDARGDVFPAPAACGYEAQEQSLTPCPSTCLLQPPALCSPPQQLQDDDETLGYFRGADSCQMFGAVSQELLFLTTPLSLCRPRDALAEGKTVQTCHTENFCTQYGSPQLSITRAAI